MNKINKNTKIYFLDLDGTLLDEKKTKSHYVVSDINRKAIEKIQEEKKHVVISTGRMGPFVQELIQDLKIEYAVTANGAIVINKKGKILKRDELSKQQFLLLLDIVKKYKLCMKVDHKLNAFGTFNFFDRLLTKRFGFIPKNNYDCEMHTQHFKVVIWGKFKRSMKKIKQEIIDVIPRVSVESSSKGWTLEITNINSTKGLGNVFVSNLLKVDLKNTIHVGDTMNDSTTQKYMKLIAMKNATNELKRIATHIGPTWKNGGISKILNGEFEKINKK